MKPDRIVENLLEAENLDQKLGALQGQAKEAGDLLDRTGKAMERTHPKAQHPELHQRLGDLQQKRREADGLLGKARYAAAYRTALHKVGLKPTDVVQRFGGEARQFALSTLRRGKYINAVETKDGRRVKLDPPVEVPPQTDVRGHGDNPTWMARLRIGQPRITAEALLRRFGVEPEMYEAAGALASVRATALAESVQIKTLKDHQKPLSEPERQQVMKAKAVWHMGKDGGPSPAVKKSVVRGRTYFWSATHRCYQSASTLKQAIRDFHIVVEPSA